MSKKIAAALAGVCILCMGSPVYAAEFTSSQVMTETEADNVFSDGTTDGRMNSFVSNLVEMTEERAQEYKDEIAAAKEAIIERQEQERAEEEKRKAEEAKRKAEEERQAKRQEVVDFALQFEGNPYVYGGTSLTNGADCSGFVMSVFKEFGYELPRVAAAQMEASTLKDVKDIEPGDLVFYGDYGIDHVAMYIGDGKIIHASTSATGIKISDYDYRQPAAVGTYMD